MFPKEFFVTSGKALNGVSELNAYDLALKNAGIHQYNIVRVSSIIPPKCTETKHKPMVVGSIAFSVMATIAAKGKLISSGIAWGKSKKMGYGLVAEAEDFTNTRAMQQMLKERISEMAEIRSIKLDQIHYRIETLNVPRNQFGCALASLVYLF